MDNLNSAVSLKSIQLLLKTFPQRRRQAQVDLLVNYAKLILLKVFQKIEDEGILSNSSYEGSVTLIPQPEIAEYCSPIILANTDVKILKILVSRI